MADVLTSQRALEILRSPNLISAQRFPLVQYLCRLASESPKAPTTLEFVLRALEHRLAFGPAERIIDDLARSVGLYPYATLETHDIRSLIAYEYHRPDKMPDNTVFHRVQADVYRLLLAGENVILSAPTSFGKSLIIDAMIATEKFTNIAVVVPTLALIDETRRRLGASFKDYKVITHNTQSLAQKNIFVLTQERVIGFDALPRIDFFVIDEFYKLGAESDESRCITLNQAFYRLKKGGGQFYLLGPNIESLPQGIEDEFRCVFYKTDFATVVSEQIRIQGKGSAMDRLVELASTLNDPTLIFCKSPNRVNEVAINFLTGGIGEPEAEVQAAASWVSDHFHADWVFGKALRQGIGLHHSRLPRALSQYVVRKFNDGSLKFLICTSTLIEGVNTKAKNVVVFDNTIAQRKFDYFTFNNIKGRSGRMFQHFVGKVYLFHEPPNKELPFVDIPLFSQGESTPMGLLVQLDDEDLSSSSRGRLEKLMDQNELSIDVIKENSSLEPQYQIDLAREIGSKPHEYSKRLAWYGFPNWDELLNACELIWQYLVRTPGQKSGIASGKQLAFKLMKYSQLKTVKTLVQFELKSARNKSAPDKAVEAVLEFQRQWVGFEAPRLFMALSRIQEFVLSRNGLPYGDYTAYAAQMEWLFRNKVAVALDEYGIPIELSDRMTSYLGTDDLDFALRRLKEFVPSKSMNRFEREVLEDARKAL